MEQDRDSKENAGREVSVYIGEAWSSIERRPGRRERFDFWRSAIGSLSQDEIAQLIAIKEDEAKTDAMTGLFNRRGFDEMALIAYAKAQREKTPLTLMVIDLDHLKPINDEIEYAEGDKAIIRVARTIDDSTRPYDWNARVGGDEFFVLLDEAGVEQAKEVAERIRDKVEKAVKKAPVLAALGRQRGESVGTVTIGLEELREGESLRSLLKRADGLKRGGKMVKKNTVFSDEEI